jgi:hypothetical protein
MVAPGAEAEPDGTAFDIHGTVLYFPVVSRGKDDAVTDVEFSLVTDADKEYAVTAKGDVASAYWSITPGMTVDATVREGRHGEFVVEQMAVVTSGAIDA